ncbi:MAG: adenylate/guanylate cyclase domain-containing protein [Desulfobacterales bacterium]|jgi:class 3 adenylate cyclase
MPHPFLEWLDENQKVQRLEIIDKVFIGRSCTGIDTQKRILVNNAQVSRDHAVISRRAKALKIKDMSKNGTWVNGIRLAAGASSDLADEDVISVGGVSITVNAQSGDSVTQERAILTEGTMVTPTEVVVTNVVADVREFSTFSQSHASADVYALMKEVFDAFSSIVVNFKGTIKDYAGDAVYAFWDHHVEPVSQQAVLACHAALQQDQALNEIRSRLSVKNSAATNLQMGWGITTGKVTLSHYGSRAADLALVGDCTNLAFRLSGIANKDLSDKIIICSQTADLVHDDFTLQDLGTIPIKGRKGQEHVFGLKKP